MRIRHQIVFAIFGLFLFGLFTGCSDATDQSLSEDGAAEISPGGKADSFETWSQCERDEVLFFLNQKSTDRKRLKKAGVHDRGAKNLMNHRKGEDDQDWTKDDQYFSSIRDVDSVHWVGQKALEALKTSAADNCKQAPEAKTDVIFSPKAFEESHITRAVEIIDNAERSLDIAMYSFGTDKVLNALKRAEARGVSIRFIFHEASENKDKEETTMSNRLEQADIDVRYVNKIMHHKFMIADGPRKKLTRANEATLFTSSGNWSYGAASRYDENTVIIENDTELTLRFQREFNTMWQNSRDFEQNREFEYNESHDIHSDMIPDRTGVDAHFTSKNFDTYVSNRYGPTFSVNSEKRHVSKQLVDLIENADESIRVASGHLRYRPVAEAIIDKHKSDSDIDIQVYLDNQEHISKGYYYYLQSELEDCLEEAEDAEAKKECKHSGFYFSYPLYEAGIDVRFKYYAYYWDYTYAKQMHHKYLIIDGDTVASGSYNISQNAEHGTFENVAVYRASKYPELVDAFESNFETMWETNRDHYDELMDQLDSADDKVPMRYEPMALSWEQVTELESKVEDVCPSIESDMYDENRRKHKYCHIE